MLFSSSTGRAPGEKESRNNYNRTILLCTQYYTGGTYLIFQVSLSEFQARLQSHGISEFSSEDDIRVLNGLIETPSRTEAPPNDTEAHSNGDHASTSEWARTVRQIMLDVSKYQCNKLRLLATYPAPFDLYSD